MHASLTDLAWGLGVWLSGLRSQKEMPYPREATQKAKTGRGTHKGKWGERERDQNRPITGETGGSGCPGERTSLPPLLRGNRLRAGTTDSPGVNPAAGRAPRHADGKR